MRGAGWTRTVVTVGALLTAPGLAGGQEQAPDPPRDEWDSVSDVIRGHEWADGINNLLDIVAAMPESSFDYRPTAPMRSFGELVVHVADVQLGFCRGLLGEEAPDSGASPPPARKGEVTEYLMGAVVTCDRAFDAATDERLVADGGRWVDFLTTMMGHTRRETGKLVTYLRLVGVEPPEVHYFAGRTWRGAGDP